MTLLRSFIMMTVLLAGPSGAALANGNKDAGRCRAMAAALAPKQKEILEMQKIRDEAAAEVERTGEAWEDAEVLRRASRSHAQTADTAKIGYDQARQVLADREMTLQSALISYNEEVGVFNRSCTSDRKR